MADLRTLLARGLALLWAGFWLFFFVAESLAWHTPVATMVPWVGAGVLFVLLAVFAWRSEVTGGVLLVVIGALTGVAYLTWPPAGLSAAVRLGTAAMLGVPPILAGMLLLTHRHVASTGRRPA